jgi:hypothetical protein
MRGLQHADDSPPDAVAVAGEVAAKLRESGVEYAFGGAIALGFWAEPRGTVDVDVTLFLPPGRPSACLQLLTGIGCEVEMPQALGSLREHGFCRAHYRAVRVDVFLPIVPFYDEARRGRTWVELDGRPVMVWQARVLAVFKMMFFRRKDLADVEQLLRVQGPRLDTQWVRARLEEMYGRRDPRLSQWDELVAETTIP